MVLFFTSFAIFRVLASGYGVLVCFVFVFYFVGLRLVVLEVRGLWGGFGVLGLEKFFYCSRTVFR